MMMDGMEAVIFDLDGSLVDSMWIWKDIDIEYLGQFGLEPPRELQREIEGMSFSETAVYFKERFGLPDSLEQIKETWNRMAWDKYRNQVPLKDGAREYLAWCGGNRPRIFILRWRTDCRQLRSPVSSLRISFPAFRPERRRG